ncbi:MAG: UTP--glucose-1-phosphate uridylyltransferase [Elusimicrobiota bacterium]
MKVLKRHDYNEKLFENLRKKYLTGELSNENNILKAKVDPPDETKFFNFKKDASQNERLKIVGAKVIKSGKLGVVIVNGGTASRFGGVVKGIIEVYDGKSFLQIKLEQIKKINQKYNVQIPIYLMNSYVTGDTTLQHLKKNNYFGLKDTIKCFNQFIAKRLNVDGSFVERLSEKETYCGLGHGNFVSSFSQKGYLSSFIKNGGEHLWYSNIDNLGAIVDEIILGYHIDKKSEMTVELVEKYLLDKGGAPAVVNGHLEIVEQFKFPQDFNQDLISVFNTATYIFKADSLNKKFNLPFYYVEKEIKGKKVIQFEQLAGDLSLYLETEYIITNREERFFPIKTPQDLEKNRYKMRNRFG